MTKKPSKILKLEALLRRLPTNYDKRPNIEEELAISKAGHRGEESLAYHLKFIQHKNYQIIRDIRLKHLEDIYFQMDTLVLSGPFILNLDVKNMSGTLFFDQDFDQLIRTTPDGKVEAFLNPILQVKRQELQLRAWLKKHKFPPVPIVSLVLISNPSTIIKTAPQHIKLVQKIVFHSAKLPFILESLETTYQKEILTSSQVNKLSKLLIKQNTPLLPDYLRKFKIRQSELLTGVHCPTCNTLPLAREKGKWYCPVCDVYSVDAHIASLVDYYFLLGETITNRECREFFHIPSRFDAFRILSSLDLPSFGTNKDKVYNLTALIEKIE